VPTAPAPATPTFSPTVDELAAFVSHLTEQGRFSGVVLVAEDDIILWEIAAGLADRQANIPNHTETRFNLGSMNKMFTAVAILQLVEDGRLRLESTFGKILPDYPNAAVAKQVTIHHLLTHTSGLGDVFTDQFAANPNQYRSNQDFLPLFVDEPLLFPPGERFLYSNAGYVVLGLIIEKVSGMSYDAYVRQNIFEPSGMSDTAAFSVDDKVPNRAIGYTTQDFYGNETGLLTDNTALMPGKALQPGAATPRRQTC
jgi:CubicO group peptidase (beta-lactamase class C family)